MKDHIICGLYLMSPELQIYKQKVDWRLPGNMENRKWKQLALGTELTGERLFQKYTVVMTAQFCEYTNV